MLCFVLCNTNVKCTDDWILSAINSKYLQLCLMIKT